MNLNKKKWLGGPASQVGEEGERNKEGRGFAGALAGDEGSLAQTRGRD